MTSGPPPKPPTPRSHSRPGSRAVCGSRDTPSVTTRAVTCWICTRPEDLKDDEAAGLAAVLGCCEHLDRLTGHVRAFARLLTTLAREQLNAWIRAVQDDTG